MPNDSERIPEFLYPGDPNFDAEEFRDRSEETNLRKNISDSEIARAREIRHISDDNTKGPNASAAAMEALERGISLDEAKKNLSKDQAKPAEFTGLPPLGTKPAGEELADVVRVMSEGYRQGEVTNVESKSQDRRSEVLSPELRAQYRSEIVLTLTQQEVNPATGEKDIMWSWGPLEYNGFAAELKRVTARSNGGDLSKLPRERLERLLLNNSRGAIAEVVSGMIPVDVAETVFTSPNLGPREKTSEPLVMFDPKVFRGGPTKRGVLEAGVLNTLARPLDAIPAGRSYDAARRPLLARYMEAIDYVNSPPWVKAKKELNPVIEKLTAATVMPDAFIISRKSAVPVSEHFVPTEIVGAVEVKAFDKVEVLAWAHMLEVKRLMESYKIVEGEAVPRDPQEAKAIKQKNAKETLKVSITKEDMLDTVDYMRSNAQHDLETATTEKQKQDARDLLKYLDSYAVQENDMPEFGVDLAKEVALLDMLNESRGLPRRGKDNLIVLRFAEDIPDGILAEIGKQATEYGYKVMVQKLPFSTAELAHLGVWEAKMSQADSTLDRKQLFDDSQEQLLAEMAQKYRTPVISENNPAYSRPKL